MKVGSNLKLRGSSQTLKGLEKIVNSYFYSTRYQCFPDGLVTKSRVQVESFTIKKKGSRYYLYEKI
jgi:hypothetical protein